MKKGLIVLGLLSAISLVGVTSCQQQQGETGGNNIGGQPGGEDTPPVVEETGSISLSNSVPRLEVMDEVVITPSFNDGATPSKLIIGEYDTDKIYIEQNSDEENDYSIKITMLSAKVDQRVTLKNERGLETSIRIRSIDNDYRGTSDDEEWFNEITTVNALDKTLKEGTPIGTDVSYVKQIYDNGGHYYNKDGEEECVFKILKDAGHNTVRIKQFVDPFNHEIVKEDGSYESYGGGTNDMETNLWIAKWAYYFGLDIMIDLHYSDYYADPGCQTIPKAWADATNVTQMMSYIEDYTLEVMNTYKDNGIDISYVQIGNETTVGMLNQMPGTDYDYLTGDRPGYSEDNNRYNASSSISGNIYNNNDNFANYVKTGTDAVKEVFPDAEVIVHVARGFSGLDTYENVYGLLNNVDYDIIGISSYIYFQGRPTDLTSLLSTLKTMYPTKKVMIMETSYGFTYKSNANAANSFWEGNDSGSPRPMSGYEVSPTGQAQLVRDYLNVLNNSDNGYGLFYWGGDFIPVSGSGWADSHSKSSWANQALFSYDGKALPSLYSMGNL